jgi:hypothetical protein
MSIEAMKQALEALTYIYTETTEYEEKVMDEAIAVLEQAIAEAEKIVPSDYPNSHQQEPVAWWDGKESVVFAHDTIYTPNWTDYWTKPLYADPNPCETCEALAMSVMADHVYHEQVCQQREWVGLTDEERGMVVNANFGIGVWEMARAIEDKLKEKNNG